MLKISLDLKDGERVTFISDMQKGLLDAISVIVPKANHRFCVRHIEANWAKKNKRGGEMRKMLWWCAWSTYDEDFKDQLKNLGSLSEQAVKDLLWYPPQSWCRAYFDTKCKNNMVDNNFTESFNFWILEARSKSIIKMLEDIRIKVMNMIREHEDEARNWKEDISPLAMRLFKDYKHIAQGCKVIFNGDNGYEVTEGVDRHTVNLLLKKCTCRT
ncbi:uncharacterized protein [Nicotiana tomentosiformis]|uniref:uncharacterized protein n=1 Tax=Nicotiana tomentosiformis TaxID=4098 RepID=UPI00051C1346|nr:uncharacterized protein LOC104113264 isoform X2 [Nicotiana tomentosiformis]